MFFKKEYELDRRYDIDKDTKEILTKVLCKKCNTFQFRIRYKIGKTKDKIYNVYKDRDGLIWNGKTCGMCNRHRVKMLMKGLRSKREYDGDSI